MFKIVLYIKLLFDIAYLKDKITQIFFKNNIYMCEWVETCPTTWKPIAEAPCSKLTASVSDTATIILEKQPSSLQKWSERRVGVLFKLNTEPLKD